MRNVSTFLGLGFALTMQFVLGASAPVIGPLPAQTTAESTAIVVPLSITDSDTPVASLKFSLFSDNTSILPPSGMEIVRDGNNFSLRLTPGSNQGGATTVTVVASDPEGLSDSRSFVLTVTPVNSPPEITSIPDQTFFENGSSPALTFLVADVESRFEEIAVSGSSSSPDLIPPGNILFSGTGFERRVVIKPAPSQFGLAVITLTATDPGGKSSSTHFTVNVTPLNQPPTITSISDVTVERNNGATIAVPFEVSDSETPLDFLLLSVGSSNTQLLPHSNVTVSGEGQFRVVRLTPMPGQTGRSTITLTVRDLDGRTAKSTFDLIVLSVATKAVIPDFNGDGLGDIIFQHRDGFVAAAFLDVYKLTGSSFFSPNHPGDSGWELITTADFDGDRSPDLLFQHHDGTIATWSMSGIKLAKPTLFTPSRPNEENWRVVSVADFYHDGTQDLVLQNRDGRIAAWLMNGTTLVNNALFSPSRVEPGWQIVGTGDFNRDNQPDLLFQHTDGTLGIWFMSGLRLLETALLQPSHPGDNGWRVVSLQDFDRDGNIDLMFQHTDGSLGIWFMNGILLKSSTLVSPANPGLEWRVAGPK